MLLRASASAFCRARSREYRAILTHPAVAESRQRSQWDRPTLGFVNFCPGSLSAAAAEWESQLTTAMHETLHALGFVSASWAYFREDDGTTPRTPRDESGEPVTQASYTCVDGSTWTQLRAPSANTVVIDFERGMRVNRLVTPRVVSVVRDIFGCASLTGAELENQPTSASCFGSHWEQRLFTNEVMASTESHAAILSPLTLAALEDSGWYRANYSMAEPLLWGRNEGCGYVTERCVSNSGVLDGMCTTMDSDESSFFGCSSGRRAQGQCNLIRHSADLPAQFQYFSDPRLGGRTAVYDYCPLYAATKDCSNPADAWPSSNNFRGETYGEGAFCFESSFSQAINGYVTASSRQAACHVTRCHGGELELNVALEDVGSSVWLKCSTPGQKLTMPPGTSRQGELTCPPQGLELLCKPHSCPGLPCDGTDDCNGGVCTCGTPFGTVCRFNPPPSPPPPSPPPPVVPPSIPPNEPPAPPSPPLPPASPPHPRVPPALPGGSYVRQVSFSLGVSPSDGSDDIDAEALSRSIATMLQGIGESDVLLNITRLLGSAARQRRALSSSTTPTFLVDVIIRVSSDQLASSVVEALTLKTATPYSELSQELGVTVLTMSTPILALIELDAPAPPAPPSLPPPPKPAAPPSSGSIVEILLGLPLMSRIAVAAAAAIVVLCVLFALWRTCCRSKRSRRPTATMVPVALRHEHPKNAPQRTHFI